MTYSENFKIYDNEDIILKGFVNLEIYKSCLLAGATSALLFSNPALAMTLTKFSLVGSLVESIPLYALLQVIRNGESIEAEEALNFSKVILSTGLAATALFCSPVTSGALLATALCLNISELNYEKYRMYEDNVEEPSIFEFMTYPLAQVANATCEAVSAVCDKVKNIVA